MFQINGGKEGRPFRKAWQVRSRKRVARRALGRERQQTAGAGTTLLWSPSHHRLEQCRAESIEHGTSRVIVSHAARKVRRNSQRRLARSTVSCNRARLRVLRSVDLDASVIPLHIRSLRASTRTLTSSTVSLLRKEPDTGQPGEDKRIGKAQIDSLS